MGPVCICKRQFYANEICNYFYSILLANASVIISLNCCTFLNALYAKYKNKRSPLVVHNFTVQRTISISLL